MPRSKACNVHSQLPALWIEEDCNHATTATTASNEQQVYLDDKLRHMLTSTAMDTSIEINPASVQSSSWMATMLAPSSEASALDWTSEGETDVELYSIRKKTQAAMFPRSGGRNLAEEILFLQAKQYLHYSRAFLLLSRDSAFLACVSISGRKVWYKKLIAISLLYAKRSFSRLLCTMTMYIKSSLSSKSHNSKDHTSSPYAYLSSSLLTGLS